ncbi:MAG: hypothetical protein ACRD2S_00050, partial [Terriglobales bacterium]
MSGPVFRLLQSATCRWTFAGLFTLATGFIPAAYAQDNYEIQVYGSDLVPAGNTMVELHSNFT